MLRGLIKDLENLVKTGLKPDVIAVTGDIADRGLPASRMPSSRRRTKRRAAVLRDPDERPPLLRRHAGWVDFANRFRADPIELPWWSVVVEIHGLKLHVAGFCSSWMSCSDQDKGKLLLGRWQRRDLLSRADEADLSVALMHHPWDYLADFDAEEARQGVQRRCQLVLYGHGHRQRGQAAGRPGGGVLELAAGCCYGGSTYANAYHLVEIDLAACQSRVHLRVWDGDDWIPDRNAYGGAAPEGVADFALRLYEEGSPVPASRLQSRPSRFR